MIGYFVEGGDDGACSILSLHGGSEQLCVEAVAALLQLVFEIFVTCGIGRGDDSDTSGEGRECEQLLCIEQSVRLELVDGALSLLRYVSERVGWVYADDREAKAV